MKFRKLFIILLLSIWSSVSAFCQAKIFWDSLPKPVGHVNDFEKIYTQSERNILERKIRYFEERFLVQVVIITFDTSMVSRDKMDSLTFRIANYWHVGTRYNNKGMAIGISKGHKSMYILPGIGLREYITHNDSKAIMGNCFFPYFRSEKYYEGTFHGLNRIFDLLEARLKNHVSNEP